MFGDCSRIAAGHLSPTEWRRASQLGELTADESIISPRGVWDVVGEWPRDTHGIGVRSMSVGLGDMSRDYPGWERKTISAAILFLDCRYAFLELRLPGFFPTCFLV